MYALKDLQEASFSLLTISISYSSFKEVMTTAINFYGSQLLHCKFFRVSQVIPSFQHLNYTWRSFEVIYYIMSQLFLKIYSSK